LNQVPSHEKKQNTYKDFVPLTNLELQQIKQAQAEQREYASKHFPNLKRH